MPEGGKLGLNGKIGLKVPCPRLDDCGFDPATGERFCRTLNTAELADWVPRPIFEAILVTMPIAVALHLLCTGL